MVELYGQALTRRAVAERAGELAQFAGVRLVTLGDGVERGVRMLEFRTGDRAALHAARRPGARRRRMRLQGAGDRVAFADRVPASGAERLRGRGRARLPALVLGAARHLRARPRPRGRRRCRRRATTIRGRASGAALAARAGGADPGAADRLRRGLGGRPLRAVGRGEVRQAAMFGENLHLVRRVEADVGGNEIRIRDRVVNRGFAPTPHMFSTTSTSAIRWSTRGRGWWRQCARCCGRRTPRRTGRRGSATGR